MMRRQKVTKGLNSLEMIPKSNSFSDRSNNVSDDNDDNGKLYPLNYRNTQLSSSSSSSSRTTNFYSWIKDPKNQSVFGVLASSFLSLLGFTMVSGPLTPALGKHFQLEVGSMFGFLTSAYPLGMLLGISFWPSLSDKIGRRFVLSFSLLGSGLGLMTQALVILRGGTLSQFLLARTMTGLFAGSSPVSKAYLADIGVKDGKLPRYLSLKDASSTLAFIMGPAAGGLLFDVRRNMIGAAAKDLSKAEVLNTSGSLAFVIAISSVASILASLLAGLLVKERSSVAEKDGSYQKDSNHDDEDDDNSATIKIGNTDKDNGKDELISCPLGQSLWMGVASVCIISFLFNVGDSTFHAFFSAFLRSKGIITKDIGLIFTGLACISFLVSTTLTSNILKLLGPALSCASGLTLTGLSLVLLGLTASGTILLQPSLVVLTAIAAIYFCGVSVYGPTIPTMLLRCVPSNRRGFILGVDGTINTLARIVTPIFMGAIYRRYDAGTTFVAAGCAAVCGAAITLIRRLITLRENKNLLKHSKI